MKAKNVLSRDECEVILQRRLPGAALAHFEIAPFSEDVNGFLGDYFLLTLHAQHQQMARRFSFFVKTLPYEHDLQMEYTVNLGAFDNEVFFYDRLLKEFAAHSDTFDLNIFPRYYYSRHDLIVLENLADEDYRLADTDHVLDMDHIELVLRTVAKYHSASIAYDERKSAQLQRKYQIVEDHGKHLQEPFFRDDKEFLGYKFSMVSLDCLLTVIDLMPDMQDISKDRFKREYRKSFEDCFEKAKPSKVFRNVCCHGDLWRKNILFKYDAGKPASCKLLDFQIQKYTAPAYDVLKFLHQVTTSDIRKDHLDYMLQYYHSCLARELKLAGLSSELLSWDEFQASCKHVLMYVKIEASFYYSYQKFGFDFLKEIMSSSKKFRQFSFVDRSSFAVEHYKPGMQFKRWMDEILHEIKDIIVHGDFSREDCHRVLRGKFGTDYRLVGYTLQPVEQKAGILAEHAKLLAEVDISNERRVASFFLKRLPDSALNNFVVVSGAFQNEKFVYDHIFPKMEAVGVTLLDACVGKCYLSRRNEVLVFDDLNQAGFTTPNKRRKLTYEEVAVIFRTLARFHSASLIFEEKLSQGTKKFSVVDEYETVIQETLYSSAADHCAKPLIENLSRAVLAQADMFPCELYKISNAEFGRKIKQIYSETMYEMVKPSKKYRNVICHGDLWHNNVLVKYDDGVPVDSKFVDFQLPKLCPPAQDIMFFLYVTTTQHFRDKHFDALLELYHAELGRCLREHGCVGVISLEELRQSCRHYELFAVAQMVCLFHVVMMTAEDMQKYYADEQVCQKLFYEDRAWFVEMVCSKDAQYKAMQEESITLFRKLCETWERP